MKTLLSKLLLTPIIFLTLLIAIPAIAFVYTGNPNNDILCGYMDPDGPQTHWDGDDPPQYQGDPYMEYSGSPTISYYCDRSWASIHFGAQDLDPGSGVKRRVFGYSSGPGYEDDSVCWITYNGNDWQEYDLHLRN